eukprot:CAMPEP_0195291482 /NCGR_PEP_ID=MMETSP0707-20130614/7819_1 /TAXON_ID=33640 /ORGANISM="Asterionellopsis glacialis, Strain CCMP134" /LENGTH=830 /DNA_ID=CAMNT_0040351801 /DNA_START=351 /DNA_END=2843 /DNA_ORIENTATION=+
MAFTDLDRSIELRKRQAKAAVNPSGSHKRNRDYGSSEEALMQQIQAESSYLLLSHTSLGGGHSGDRHNHRTGRWTSEEIAFVDQLVKAFDQGYLALPHGVKLNEFLGEMLLCKSSRLTKKMKNAKLSTRSYSLQDCTSTFDTSFYINLSSLQESFLQSVISEPTQLELRFNMSKLWRTHFSNLCLQVSYEALDARGWLQSLEEMEQRASDTEEMVRRARRQRMGFALKKDVGQKATTGVFIGGMSAKDASVCLGSEESTPVSVLSSSKFQSTLALSSPRLASMTFGNKDEKDDSLDLLSNVLEMSTVGGENHKRPRLYSDDMSFAIDDLVDPLNMMPVGCQDQNQSVGDQSPFLSHIVEVMKSENLPFQHADLWVPSFMAPDGGETADRQELRLFHAGFLTRNDLSAFNAFQLNEYGAYSSSFSFAPGVGLPGRVYAGGKSSWEMHLHEADPEVFERAGGAKVYGVKTGLGIPVESLDVGRVIVVLYSTSDVPEDSNIVQKCLTSFSVFSPEPKWKLVIDVADPSSSDKVAFQGAAASTFARNTSASMKTSVTKASDVTLVCHDHSTHSTNGLLDNSKHRSDSLVLESSTHSSISLPPLSRKGKSNAVSRSKTETKSLITHQECVEEQDDMDIETRIASLLGDHMPANDADVSADLLEHFMSLRLLLLRSASRRTTEEVEMIDILKKSFDGYSRDGRRSGSDLAKLLAKDWMYLRTTMAATTAARQDTGSNPSQHQSHVISLRKSSTTSPPTSSALPPPSVPSPQSQLSNPSTNHPMAPRPVTSFSSNTSLEQVNSLKLDQRGHLGSTVSLEGSSPRDTPYQGINLVPDS